MCRLLLVPALVLGLQVATASAQTPLACDGDIAIVRISTIKPASNLQAYMKAQEAHIAWYRAQGFKDNQIYSARVIVLDEKTKQPKYSDTDLMSFHVRPPDADGDQRMATIAKDKAGWDAYVKQYRDSSDIKSETFVCLPKNR